MPVVNKECPKSIEVDSGYGANNKKTTKEQEENSFRYRLHYSRLEDSRFYGHLELLQLVFRVLKRVGLPVLFSKGYNPSPKVSFSQALPVGVESLVEFFDVELAVPLRDLETVKERLNAEFPETFRVASLELVGKTQPKDQLVTYLVTLPDGDWRGLETRITDFMATESFCIERIRKRKRKQLDVRPLVHSVHQEGRQLEIIFVQRHSQAGIGPVLFLEKVFALSPKQAKLARIQKIALEEL